MDTDWLAPRMDHLGTNAIREILKVVNQPGMISLAGGIPAPESFPLDLIETLTRQALEIFGASVLQYDATEGFGPLREALAKYLNALGIETASDQILVASGSQGVLDAVGKVCIGRGDAVAVEAPTYLGALQAFSPYGPRYLSLATDGGGVLPEALEALLERHPIKLIYLVPTFQNPTGRTLSLARRRTIAELVQAHDVLLVEDDPYSALRYRGTPLPPIKSFAPDHVAYISTLSKVFAPGLRIGFVVAPQRLRSALVKVKQGVDLHSTTLSQALAAIYLDGGHLKDHLPHILRLYRPRQSAMLEALERHFPADFTWSRPEGGMFVWAEGPDGLDMEAVYWQAVERGAAFVPGKYFYTEPGQGNATMRLNFTMAKPAEIDKAIEVLAGVIKAQPGTRRGAQSRRPAA
ncbi:MAG: PLP-dependent aminotransferase family protein [Desulfosarcinaceae bacterium]|jgi:2-aminoadipate transaminase